MTDYEAEAAEAKVKLGIGISLKDRIEKLKRNQYQYATAGDTKALIDEIENLRATGYALAKMATEKAETP